MPAGNVFFFHDTARDCAALDVAGRTDVKLETQIQTGHPREFP